MTMTPERIAELRERVRSRTTSMGRLKNPPDGQRKADALPEQAETGISPDEPAAAPSTSPKMPWRVLEGTQGGRGSYWRFVFDSNGKRYLSGWYSTKGACERVAAWSYRRHREAG